jgi:hypothetical protein
MSAQLQHDPDDLKRAFRQGGHGRDMDARLDAVAEVGAKSGFEDAKEQIIDKLDTLIWRRKIANKEYGELDDIRDMVSDLEVGEE